MSAAVDGDEIVLRVRDTGIGIGPDMLPRVFDLFVQGRQALDRSAGGLGLGLTIVRSLVERHGGRVSAHSDGPGQGSEFVVRLPAARVGVPHEDAQRRTPASQATGAWRAVLLVVDDNQDAAALLARGLRLMGHEVHVAHDGLDALRLAALFPLDVAFLDIGLPLMDGFELAARLRELPTCRDAGLIAVTGYGQSADRQRTIAAGFHEHLVKPVDLDTVEQLVMRFSPRDRVTHDGKGLG